MTTAILSKELYHAINNRDRREYGVNPTRTKDEILYDKYKNQIADIIQKRSREGFKDRGLNYIVYLDLTRDPNIGKINSDTIKEWMSRYGLDVDLDRDWDYVIWSKDGKPYPIYERDYDRQARWDKNYDAVYQSINDSAFGKGNLKRISNTAQKVATKIKDSSKSKDEEDRRKKKDSMRHAYDSYFDTLEHSKSIPMTDEELYHHGILGMKWGIRRFQNEDGTLTPAGKKRYLTTYVTVDNKGNTTITAAGDADMRRRDLEKQNERDAAKELWANRSFRMANILGIGGAATTASLGLIGGMGLANPAVAAAGMAGSAALAGVGYNVGAHRAKKQTGLDDEPAWSARNLKKYALDTSNLGYDVKWMNTSDLAKLKNGLNRRDLLDSIWNDDATINLGKKNKP